MKTKKLLFCVAITVILIVSIVLTQMPGILNASASDAELLAQANETKDIDDTIDTVDSMETQHFGEIDVINRSIRVYSSPTKRSETIWLVNNGDIVIINTSYENKRWYQVEYNGITGYIKRRYVNLTDTVGDNVSASDIASPTASPTESPEASATASPTETPEASATASPTESPEASATASPTESPETSATASPTESPEASATASPTETPEASATASPTETPATDNADNDDNENNVNGGGLTIEDNIEIVQDAYTIDNAQFGIDNTGGNARATTDGINNALEWAKEQGYTEITFAEGTYLIQCNWQNRYIAPTDGIMVPSGLTLNLNGATFKMEDNSYPEYCIFAIVEQSNVVINGGTLIGDLDNHSFASSSRGDSHEWGFGIAVVASSNVTINGVTIRKMTGDGIILEGSYDYLSNGGSISSDVKVLNCDISYCRRQGISIVGAVNSEIAGNLIYGISGTDPQYGIDVEPELDYPSYGLKIHDNTIYGCSGGAITCCKGSDYEVYNNTVTGNHILAALSSNVKIYGNTVNDSYIHVMSGATNITVENNNLDANSWVQID